MKERGIIFTAWSIPKIPDGTKTQTRRTWGLEWINQDPDAFKFLRMEGDLAVFHLLRDTGNELLPQRTIPKKIEGVDPNVLFYIKCPYGQVGDRLKVKETWRASQFFDDLKPSEIWLNETVQFKDGQILTRKPDAQDFISGKWRSSLFMPRWASRIDLEITEVRAERLQDITWQDCISEGIEAILNKDVDLTESDIICAFATLWDSINPKYPWEANNWVWPISFKEVK